MKRHIALSGRAKKVILNLMEDMEEITAEGVVKLIEPHYSFDISKAREQALRKAANQIIARFKDEKGIRVFYNYTDDEGASVYVNVDATENIDALDGVEKQLNRKYFGLNVAKEKIERRKQEISGQMGLEDLSGVVGR